VPFIDVGTAGGMHYLAWPMVEGTTLDKLVEKSGPLSPEVAAHYVMQAAEGLVLCHKQKLFHGLLKPSNLMVGSDGQVRILDFGIGCLLAETEGESLVDTMSTANSVNSGLDCASPESIMDPTNLTPLGDQYSLGCVLYFLLAGRYPFPDGTAVEKMMAHQHKQPTHIKQLATGIPAAIAAVVDKLMEKGAASRYPTCAELVEALRPFASTAPPQQRRAAPAVKTPPAVKGPRPPAPGGQTHAASAPPETVVPSLPERPLSRPRQPLPPRAPSRDAAARMAPPALPPRAPAGNRPAGHGAPRPHAAPPALPPSLPAGRPQPQPHPEPETAAFASDPELHAPVAPPAPSSLGQRLGTVGVLIVAIAAGALAWLLASYLPLKF
jgi:serine/threonine-protein kinase